MAADRSTLARRVAMTAVLTGVVWFAIEGGEFGTTDLLHQRREKARISRSIDSVQRIVDSLRAYETAVTRDPATQERIAREVFGLVRGDKELLYRFVDSAKGDRRP